MFNTPMHISLTFAKLNNLFKIRCFDENWSTGNFKFKFFFISRNFPNLAKEKVNDQATIKLFILYARFPEIPNNLRSNFVFHEFKEQIS
jgi:hypothetical protein